MKSSASFLSTLLLLTSGPGCSPHVSTADAALNRSALHAPQMVTLLPIEYQFAEGRFKASGGEVFHGDYSYQNAFLLGIRPPKP